MNAQRRVAVVAIHGVGDPKPGESAAALAKLLVVQEGFVHEEEGRWLVRVEPVPTGSGRDHPDPGLRLHQQLLHHTELPEQDQVYEAQRHRLHKGEEKIDVIDLYWGDLSGLKGAATTILSELYTLGLRFAQLGHDAVRQFQQAHPTRRDSPLLHALVSAHHASAAVLTHPIVVLNVLLLLTAAWWMVVALAAQQLPGYRAVRVVLGAAAIASWIWCLYFGVRARRLALAAAVTLVFAGFSAWGEQASQPWLQPLAAFVLAGVFLYGYLRFLALYKVVVPRVEGFGIACAIGLFAVLPVGVYRRYQHLAAVGADDGDFPSQTWAFATANALEMLLAVLIVCWMLLGLSAAASALAGWRIRRLHPDDLEAQRAIDTGRFGLYCSVSLFLLLTVGAWTLLLQPVASAFGAHRYVSLFQTGMDADTIEKLAVRHFQDLAGGLAWVLLQLSVLLLLAASLLVPSVLAELRPPRPGVDGRHLGHWLTHYGRKYALLVSAVAFWAALLMAVIAVVHACALAPSLGMGSIDAWLKGLPPIAAMTNWAGTAASDPTALQDWTGLAAGAGSLLGIVSIGGRLFASVGRLRIPVDVAMDVDNHFRDFPLGATPRARIAARLFSVLCAVRDAGYDRVVIVAHSQGTVIVADLLRHLHRHAPQWQGDLASVRLFTCGCPLRQLYASRFPALYRWVETGLAGSQATGPDADELGVAQWTNAYASGDYVGRWLWMDAGVDPLKVGVGFQNGRHRQVCLGKGAHTHYYDLRMAAVAREVHALIA